MRIVIRLTVYFRVHKCMRIQYTIRIILKRIVVTSVEYILCMCRFNFVVLIPSIGHLYKPHKEYPHIQTIDELI